MRRLAEGGAERADEMGLGDAGDAGQRGDVERPRIGSIHGIAGAEQPAVVLLDVAGHSEVIEGKDLESGKWTEVASEYPVPLREANYPDYAQHRQGGR